MEIGLYVNEIRWSHNKIFKYLSRIHMFAWFFPSSSLSSSSFSEPTESYLLAPNIILMFVVLLRPMLLSVFLLSRRCFVPANFNFTLLLYYVSRFFFGKRFMTGTGDDYKEKLSASASDFYGFIGRILLTFWRHFRDHSSQLSDEFYDFISCLASLQF